MSINTRNKISAALGFARTFAAALAVCAVISSCEIFHADNPSQIGSITMSLPSAEQMSAARDELISGSVTTIGILGDSAVASFKVKAKNALTGFETVQTTSPGSIVRIFPLDPGFWKVTVFGYNSNGKLLYYGNTSNIFVVAGNSTPASVVINPVNDFTPIVASLSEAPAGAALQNKGRENVTSAYISYSSGKQSGAEYYDFSSAAGAAKQPSDLNKIIIPIPAFLEPGSSLSGKVYFFGRGGSALWGGAIKGSVKDDGTFACDFVFLETKLVGNYQNQTRTFLKIEEPLAAQLETPLAYSFETMAYGAQSGETKSYSDLTITSAAPSEACGNIPVIVECGSSAWAGVFDAKHKYAEPTVTMPEQKVPLGATRTLSAVVSSSEQKEYSVFRAAQDYDARGFKLYSIQDKDTGSTVSASSYAAPASPVSSEFTAPDKVKATGSGSDEYTWQVTVTNSVYSYFDGGESQASKTFSGTFNVSGSAWTITPASVTVERGAAFALTLSCADATPADAASVTKVTLNATSAKDFVPAVSGTSLVVNAEDFATWTGAAPKKVSVLVESVDAGMIEVTATAPSGGGGGGGSGSNPQGMTYGDFVQMPFSVSATKQVYFSPGNLWYQATTNTYKFAEKQSDIVGESGNDSVAADYDGWIDQFPWGSSGFKEIHPYTRNYSETRDGKTIYETMHIPGMTGEYANFDWGVYNAISNGGNQARLWRTLTSEEWNYLFNSRSGAPSKRAPARVNGIAGMVLLPDTWNNDSTPSGLEFNLTPPNSASSYQIWATNEYNALQWSQMEAQGAVFLPAAGSQYSVGSWEHCSHNNPDSSNDIYLKYWTATGPTDTSETKYCIRTTSGGYNSLSTTDNPSVSRPTPVRLCQNTSGYTQVTPISPNKIYVAATGGSDTDGDGTESHPYESLAQACKKIKSFAEAQDYTIFVDGNLTTKQTMTDTSLTSAYAKSITVKGKNGIDANTGEPNDSITGNGGSSSGPLLTIEMPAPVIIKDLKLKGGYDSLGGGIKIGDGQNNTTYCDVTLGSGVLVTENEAYSLGAGVYTSPYSKLTIDGAVISKNEINHPTNNEGGSGIYFYGSELLIKGDSKINGNLGSTTSQPCPAIYCPFDYNKNPNSTVTIEDNAEICRNEGTAIRMTTGTLNIRGNAKISNNENKSSSGYSGGVYIGSSNSIYRGIMTVSGNAVISDNKATYGAGIYAGSCYTSLNIEGGVISGNIATTKGGGIYVYGVTVNMSGGQIVNNQVTNATSGKGGGGVCLESGQNHENEGRFFLTGGIIKGNTVNSAGSGAGVFVNDTVCNSTSKPATFSMGAAAKVDSDNDVYLMRTTTGKPTIVIDTALTQTGTLATITLGAYVANDPVLSGIEAKTYYTRFTLSDTGWHIEADGTLAENP